MLNFLANPTLKLNESRLKDQGKARYRGAVVLEVVLVIAILIAIAVIFNSEVRQFAETLFATVFGQNPAADIMG